MDGCAATAGVGETGVGGRLDCIINRAGRRRASERPAGEGCEVKVYD